MHCTAQMLCNMLRELQTSTNCTKRSLLLLRDGRADNIIHEHSFQDFVYIHMNMYVCMYVYAYAWHIRIYMHKYIYVYIDIYTSWGTQKPLSLSRSWKLHVKTPYYKTQRSLHIRHHHLSLTILMCNISLCTLWYSRACSFFVFSF